MSGYIGPQPVPQATQHRESFTATAAQTSFATAGYTPQFIDVYLNGVKLAAADYTAVNGSDIVLTSGAAVNDILEYVAYTPFGIADQTFTGTTITTNLTVGKSVVGTADAGSYLTATGQIGATTVGATSGSPNLILRRDTTDGDMVVLRKEATAVGTIGNTGSDIYMRRGGSLTGIYINTAGVLPSGTSSLGQPSDRWTDLYLSGGVFLGGTTVANKLDDYEEGTWTPTFSSQTGSVTATYSAQHGFYTKVGNLVYAFFDIVGNITAATGPPAISGFPFASSVATRTYNMAHLRSHNAVGFSTATHSGIVGYMNPGVAQYLVQLITSAGVESPPPAYAIGNTKRMNAYVIYNVD
jgi:hypothetical protein